MKLALLAPDNREALKRYDLEEPIVPAVEAALLEGLARQPCLEVHYISCLQQPVRSPKKLADNIWFHSLHVPKVGWMRTLYQGCIRAVRRKLRDLQPDLVHGQGSERECAISAVFSGYPNVITIHGNMKAIAELYRSRIGSFYWLASRMETFALRNTCGVLCNSAYTERRVAPRAKRVWRVANAVRTAFFNQPQHQSHATRPILLNVGVVQSHKRQKEILTVVQKLWQRGLHFEMHFVGTVNPNAAYSADFLQQLAEAKAFGYVHHLGVLQIEQLISAMDVASALIHFPTEESFGLVVAESLARKLNLFASSVGGIVDITAGIEGAYLFSINDWVGLEDSLALWIEAGCPKHTGSADVMRRRYHPAIVAQKHVEIYRKILQHYSR